MGFSTEQFFRYNRTQLSSTTLKSAPVAQLDRANGYEPLGREFESLRAHHLPSFVFLFSGFFNFLRNGKATWGIPVHGKKSDGGSLVTARVRDSCRLRSFLLVSHQPRFLLSLS